ncbi:hypothetical protein G7B40_008440 [Aetokthonos hydrillicola Thurmond2011]|jgi:hypothetical protein|uniref:Uncharacterized protein n=1 Tax=Aetokthonos hydrillicola Thurmond2011 TaxID=2712845 RepID=A0AAP5I7E4_9CYAN|nr:hypothetical protein [Aetokthonos hydrillicola]MBW4591032.1 hypothetical protein [Aetokthonos hydrillicola CCALA 1050]MDR9894598.1 hypothetical protein [Aetokthonos hydrillicola Thurmond2011]
MKLNILINSVFVIASITLVPGITSAQITNNGIAESWDDFTLLETNYQWFQLPIHPAFMEHPNNNKISLINLNRAENLARQAAEQANGGLQHYRAQNSMYGPAEDSPYNYNGDGSWTFTFKGHSPDSDTPTVESVVTVSRTRIVRIDYNGPIRSTP